MGGGQRLIFSESTFCVIQLSTIAIRPYTLVKLQIHQISIYLISILKFLLIIMSLLSKKRIT